MNIIQFDGWFKLILVMIVSAFALFKWAVNWVSRRHYWLVYYIVRSQFVCYTCKIECHQCRAQTNITNCLKYIRWMAIQYEKKLNKLLRRPIFRVYTVHTTKGKFYKRSIYYIHIWSWISGENLQQKNSNLPKETHWIGWTKFKLMITKIQCTFRV